MQCPKCSYTRSDQDNLVPDWQCPKCGIVYAKFRKLGENCVSITLTSGQKIEFREIKLFEATQVAQFNNLSQSIEKNFRGFSTGIGFIGDVEDVVVGSLVTGAIEGVVSGAMADTGKRQIEEANQLLNNIRRTAAYVPVSAIENIELPQMELWRAPHFKVTNRKDMIQMPNRYITVRSESGECNVFWDKIESYQYQ